VNVKGVVDAYNNPSVATVAAAVVGLAGPLGDVAAKGIKGAANALDAGADFFEGTRYTDKVVGQMKQGDLHDFPESVGAFQDAGKVSDITGGDGVVRQMLTIPGDYRGRIGNFEFIKEGNGDINHRLFRPSKE
jgi:filamentous hemagglutinin